MSGSTLNVLYDLGDRPPQYDFFTFLAQIKTAVKGHSLHVVFVPSEEGGYAPVGKYGESEFNEAEGLYRLIHICLPACMIYGVTHTILPSRDAPLPSGDWLEGVNISHAKLIEIWKETGELYRPKATLRSSELVGEYMKQFDKPVITITLRETWREKIKNSRRDDWLEFAQRIAPHFQPVFVPDTSRAFHAWDHPFPIFPVAAIDLDTRLALYEQADMNCFTANGPGNMCWWTDVPFLFFNTRVEGYWTEEEWIANGLPIGTQPPYLKERQKVIWEVDSIDVIEAAFAEAYTT